MIKSLNIILLFPVLSFANAELPDPTRPANYITESSEPIYVEVFDESETKVQKSWRLSAIRVSESDKSAILNGKLVREGDDIEQAKVLEINSRSVVIDHEEQKLIVRLFNNLVVKDYKTKNKIEKNDEN